MSMLRQIRLSAAVIAMVALPNLAAADQLSDNWKICDGTGPADQRIEACSWIIKSGRETKKNIAIAYGNRGAAYRAKDDLDSAIRDYDEVIRLDPTYAEAYDNRGDAWLDKKDYDRATADYSEAIRLFPSNPTYLNDRCWTRAVAGRDLPQALSDCDQALRIRPNYESALKSR